LHELASEQAYLLFLARWCGQRAQTLPPSKLLRLGSQPLEPLLDGPDPAATVAQAALAELQAPHGDVSRPHSLLYLISSWLPHVSAHELLGLLQVPFGLRAAAQADRSADSELLRLLDALSEALSLLQAPSPWAADRATEAQRQLKTALGGLRTLRGHFLEVLQLLSATVHARRQGKRFASKPYVAWVLGLLQEQLEEEFERDYLKGLLRLRPDRRALYGPAAGAQVAASPRNSPTPAASSAMGAVSSQPLTDPSVADMEERANLLDSQLGVLRLRQRAAEAGEAQHPDVAFVDLMLLPPDALVELCVAAGDLSLLGQALHAFRGSLTPGVLSYAQLQEQLLASRAHEETAQTVLPPGLQNVISHLPEFERFLTLGDLAITSPSPAVSASCETACRVGTQLGESCLFG
jgi:hypothetical protein